MDYLSDRVPVESFLERCLVKELAPEYDSSVVQQGFGLRVTFPFPDDTDRSNVRDPGQHPEHMATYETGGPCQQNRLICHLCRSLITIA
jgi:hypothetical protein